MASLEEKIDRMLALLEGNTVIVLPKGNAKSDKGKPKKGKTASEYASQYLLSMTKKSRH